MSVAAIFLLLTFAALMGSQLLSGLSVAWARRSGLYPRRGQATDADIHRLIQSGNRSLAMRCHREVHGSTLRQARHEVDAVAAQLKSAQ